LAIAVWYFCTIVRVALALQSVDLPAAQGVMRMRYMPNTSKGTSPESVHATTIRIMRGTGHLCMHVAIVSAEKKKEECSSCHDCYQPEGKGSAHPCLVHPVVYILHPAFGHINL